MFLGLYFPPTFAPLAFIYYTMPDKKTTGPSNFEDLLENENFKELYYRLEDFVKEKLIKRYPALEGYRQDLFHDAVASMLVCLQRKDFVLKTNIERFFSKIFLNKCYAESKRVKPTEWPERLEVAELVGTELLDPVRKEAVFDSIEKLDVRYQTVLIKKYQNGEKYEKIAKEMNLSVSSVKRLVSEAKKNLLDLLRDHDAFK